MKVLGVDPGYGRVGWGVIDTDPDLRCLGYGCIDTDPNLLIVRRYHQIASELSLIIAQYWPGAVGVEKLFFSRNKTTGMKVSEARGVIMLTIYERAGLDMIFEPTPNQVKAEIGDAQADKKAVQQMIKHMLGLDRVPKPDDAADALAVALYAESRVRLNNMVDVAG